MRYLILIHSNPKSWTIWDALTEEQRSSFGADHMALSEELARTGELVASEGLPGPEYSTWVTSKDGHIATDGPFAEVKEYVAGFYLVECDSKERAIELAAMVPDARNGSPVEVRQVFDMSLLDD
ncbi:YciI family protein [Nakamurella sp. YIM 132087]|uniref:YciI family protein n=1 Tax=Nakamurella alba TaxID=2665158 RepID=A0A7K1FLI6_9ACTN|nr:YciI family protein [Nakamurella alba]MTD15011.1 YciI family protein [Nakamurella alba]